MSRLYNRNYRSCSYYQYCPGYRPSNCPCSKPISNTSIIDGSFCEITSLLQISTGDSFSTNILTKNARAITVFVKNAGNNPIVISLQNSPNGLDFTDDPQQLELNADETGYLVPYIFSKYTRVVAKSAHTGAAHIWFQMQDHSYQQYRVNNMCSINCPGAWF